MMRDITLGQYYPADSIIHRLDPRVKLLATVVFIVSIFLMDNIVGVLLAAGVLFTTIFVSKVPIRYMLKGLKAIWFILIFTVVLNMIFTEGTPIATLGPIKITEEGISFAIKMGIRLVFLVMGSSLMTLTTTPTNLTDGLEKALRPLNKIKIPVFEIALMMSIALRFIPILVEETDKIMKAQQARGADFETGNIIRRAKSMIPILVPLFVSSFRRANDLAMAMEARCYHGGKGRTKMKPLKYHGRDYVGYLLIAAFLAGSILIRIFCKDIHFYYI